MLNVKMAIGCLVWVSDVLFKFRWCDSEFCEAPEFGPVISSVVIDVGFSI